MINGKTINTINISEKSPKLENTIYSILRPQSLYGVNREHFKEGMYYSIFIKNHWDHFALLIDIRKKTLQESNLEFLKEETGGEDLKEVLSILRMRYPNLDIRNHRFLFLIFKKVLIIDVLDYVFKEKRTREKVSVQKTPRGIQNIGMSIRKGNFL
jgi:hypothetical protein